MPFVSFVPEVSALPAGHTLAKDWAYQPTSNVLTALALPFACGVSKSVYMIGISTHQTDVKSGTVKPATFSHSRENDYHRHVADLFAHHPAAIMSRSNYLIDHYSRLNTDLAKHEKNGISFYRLRGGDVTINAPEGPIGPKRPVVTFFSMVS